jgi:ABC-type polysaccharide/polyol phosphate export permease
MGPLYGALLRQPITDYFQYFSIGYVIWGFIVTYLNDSCGIFVSAESFIKQVKLPYTFYLFKALAKNLIIFCHNLIIIFFILILLSPIGFESVLAALLGGILLIANIFWMSVIFAIACIRFRDISQILSNILMLLFFLTPIMWQSNMVIGTNYSFLVSFNPIYYLLEIVRAPLLGQPPNLFAISVSVLMLLFGTLLSTFIFCKYRAKISYWV